MAVESSGAPTTSGSSSNIDEEEEEEEEIPAPMETEPAEEPTKPQPGTTDALFTLSFPNIYGVQLKMETSSNGGRG